MKNKSKVKVTKNGPYFVSGNLPLAKVIAIVGKEGDPEEWKKGKEYPRQEEHILCRCGKSQNKPYCDQTHIKIDFKGEETASHKEYLKQAEKISGPELDLTDAEKLCAEARFCHLSRGTWHNVRKSDNPDSRKIAIQTAGNCPSGRLVVWDKRTGKPIEPVFEPSVELIEDPQENASGPIWLKGGIEFESADGTKYEMRNRVTLCRCGKSNNKPFCDGSHIGAQFNDGDESLK